LAIIANTLLYVYKSKLKDALQTVPEELEEDDWDEVEENLAKYFE